MGGNLVGREVLQMNDVIQESPVRLLELAQQMLFEALVALLEDAEQSDQVMHAILCIEESIGSCQEAYDVLGGSDGE